MSSLLLLVLLSTAFYYLGSRATITSFVWDRYPPAFGRFMDCAACSGFWYGILVSTAFVVAGRDLPLELTPDVLSILVCGWISMVLTPIGAGLLQRGFEMNGSTL
jgi:hypothetical protein